MCAEHERGTLLRVAKELREEAELYTPDVRKSARAQETRARLCAMAEKYEREANEAPVKAATQKERT